MLILLPPSYVKGLQLYTVRLFVESFKVRYHLLNYLLVALFEELEVLKSSHFHAHYVFGSFGFVDYDILLEGFFGK